jgi:hypothetical protein
MPAGDLGPATAMIFIAFVFASIFPACSRPFAGARQGAAQRITITGLKDFVSALCDA